MLLFPSPDGGFSDIFCQKIETVAVRCYTWHAKHIFCKFVCSKFRSGKIGYFRISEAWFGWEIVSDEISRLDDTREGNLKRCALLCALNGVSWSSA